MCLKFDPEENTLKQTCSGKCKNKCGFVLDRNENAEDSTQNKSRVVKVKASEQGVNQFIKTPIKNHQILSKEENSQSNFQASSHNV